MLRKVREGFKRSRKGPGKVTKGWEKSVMIR